MKVSKILKALCITGLTSVLAVALVACGGEQESEDGMTGGVAATVNGTEIAEDKITKDVNDFRQSSSLQEEDAWGQWLADNSYTPQTIREDLIDYYVQQELIKQAAKDEGIEIDQTKVNDTVTSMKANYESDEAWNEALSAAGMTEDSYREAVEIALASQALQEKYGVAGEIPEEEILEYAQMYASAYDGAKRSSHILFNEADEATANEVLGRINAGELDFAAAATEYSQDTASAAKGGDVGWDKLNSFVTEYTDALSTLELDQVSGLVKSTYGYHIIKCTAVFTAPEQVTSTDQIPSEFLDSIMSSLESSKASQAYTDWLAEYEEKADIVINEMPENVPYNVDMSKYESTTKDDSSTTIETTPTDESDKSSDSATNTGDGAAEGEASGESTGEGTSDQPAAS